MTTNEVIDRFGQAVAAAIRADMEAAGLPVGVLARRTGIPRARLVHRLAGAGLVTSELEVLALALGRRPSEWLAMAEQAVEQSHI